MSRGRRRTWGTHVPQRPCSHSPYRGPLAVPRCICATIGPRSSNARAPTALTRTLPTLPVVLRTLPQLQCPCTHCLHLLTFPLAPRSHPPRSCSAPARTASTTPGSPRRCLPWRRTRWGGSWPGRRPYRGTTYWTRRSEQGRGDGRMCVWETCIAKQCEGERSLQGLVTPVLFQLSIARPGMCGLR